MVITTVLGIANIPSILIFIIGLWYQQTRFMVLGLEGFVYKLRARAIRGFSWEEIKIDIYNFSYINSVGVKSVRIHIIMPNGDLIKVEPEDYSCKEISRDLQYSLYKTLIVVIFTLYYDYGKNKALKWQARRTEEHKKKPQPVNSTMSTNMFIIDTWRDQLKEALFNYKKKKYNFGKYWTSEQIQDAFLRKKIFVLRGGITFGVWFIMLLPLIVPIILILVTNPIYMINLIIFTVIIWFCFSSPLFLVKIGFLVISSSGVYYRKFIKKSLFSWDDVAKIEGTTKEGYPNLSKEFAAVKIFLLSGKKIAFVSNNYKKSEFSKKVFMEMFLNLFNSNFKLTRSY